MRRLGFKQKNQATKWKKVRMIARLSGYYRILLIIVVFIERGIATSSEPTHHMRKAQQPRWKELDEIH